MWEEKQISHVRHSIRNSHKNFLFEDIRILGNGYTNNKFKRKITEALRKVVYKLQSWKFITGFCQNTTFYKKQKDNAFTIIGYLSIVVGLYHLYLFLNPYVCFVLFFSFYFWLNDSSHMKRLRLVNWFVCLFGFLGWNRRLKIHNLIVFRQFPKCLHSCSFIYCYFNVILPFILSFTIFVSTHFTISLLDPRMWPERVLWIRVCPSVFPSFHHSVLLSGSFLRIGKLVFLKLSMVLEAYVLCVTETDFKKIFLSQKWGKWAKNSVFGFIGKFGH